MQITRNCQLQLRIICKKVCGTYVCIQVLEKWSVADTDRNLEKFKREQRITEAAKIDILTSKDVEQIIPVYLGDIDALFAHVAAYGKRLGCG